MRNLRSMPLAFFAFALALALLTGCGGADAADDTATRAPAAGTPAEGGIRLVSPSEGADLQNSPEPGQVILDVRTAEEFAEGRLAGATMLDFYREDFADQLAQLDPEVPYLVYCRSGNRSGQATALMEQLGFADVAEIDGGILSWAQAGLPVVSQ